MLHSISALLLLSVAVAPGLPVSIDGLQSLDGTRHHRIESAVLDKSLHVLVGLPDGYDASADIEYPTVYVLDGGELYPLLKSYAHYLANGGDAPGLIIVGMSYGARDYPDGNDRSHDYTAPSDEREYWGGAGAFQEFLADELLPMIESQYRSRADRRILFGQSLGGQFVLYSAQTRPGLFWGRIASNPALHRNLPLFLEMHPEPPRNPTFLYVGSAENDHPDFREPALAWIVRWSEEDDKPWRLHAETLAGHNHFSAPPSSFRRGIRWLFAD